MSWHFLEKWMEKSNSHSSLIGRYWINFIAICRLILVSSTGDRVYSDEKSEFKCNTQQVGCANVCFDEFNPVSHLRFWGFQILFSAIPSIMFVVYSGHVLDIEKQVDVHEKISMKEARRMKKMRRKENLKNSVEAPSTYSHKTVDRLNSVSRVKKRAASTESHRDVYRVVVLARLLVETAFFSIQLKLYGFAVPEIFKCDQWPCPNTVDCYISRPTEKTIFLNVMLIYTTLCMLLNMVEFCHIVEFRWRPRKNKGNPVNSDEDQHELQEASRRACKLDMPSNACSFTPSRYLEETETDAISKANKEVLSRPRSHHDIGSTSEPIKGSNDKIDRYARVIFFSEVDTQLGTEKRNKQ